MKIGFIGLGRMGMGLALNLIDHKHKVVVYNRSPDKTQEAAKHGAIPTYAIPEFIRSLPKPRVIWLMITAGQPTQEVLDHLEPFLEKADIIIEGGNSYFQDSIKRAEKFAKKGVHFIDCGTSGGMQGARYGACMMLGGDEAAFKYIEPAIKDVCTKEGYARVGDRGSGHFVKMVHNGIEYGMMAALGEGFQAHNKFENQLSLNMKEIAKVYSHGSIVEGKLMSLLEKGINRPDFSNIKGTVPQGETEDEMKKLAKITDMPVLKQAILSRVKSRKKNSFSGKIQATLRNEFGGHKLELQSDMQTLKTKDSLDKDKINNGQKKT